jgi:hypothetical protein
MLALLAASVVPVVGSVGIEPTFRRSVHSLTCRIL